MDEKRNFTLLTDFYELRKQMISLYLMHSTEKIHPEAAMRSPVVWNR